MKNIAIIFPGQGTQSIDMFQDFDINTEVKTAWESFKLKTNIDIFNIIKNQESNINLSYIAQPLLLSLAYIQFKEFNKKFNNIKIKYLAGHSLGEYSALCCASSMNFFDALNLVYQRGKIMYEFCPVGSMFAIIGLEANEIEKICKRIPNSYVSNYNSKLQSVISTTKNQEENVIDAFAKHNARAIKLNVGSLSHCELLKKAKNKFSSIINEVSMKLPNIPLIHNIDANTCSDIEQIKTNLLNHLIKPVLWKQTIEKMIFNKVDTIIEIGPKAILTKLIKKDYPTLKCYNIKNKLELDNFKILYDNRYKE